MQTKWLALIGVVLWIGPILLLRFELPGAEYALILTLVGGFVLGTAATRWLRERRGRGRRYY
jgi:peptidoglycan/LPS O-acetylase OafA/YrhL